jgi:hypothetical protein
VCLGGCEETWSTVGFGTALVNYTIVQDSESYTARGNNLLGCYPLGTWWRAQVDDGSHQNGVGEAAAKEESRNPTPTYYT